MTQSTADLVTPGALSAVDPPADKAEQHAADKKAAVGQLGDAILARPRESSKQVAEFAPARK